MRLAFLRTGLRGPALVGLLAAMLPMAACSPPSGGEAVRKAPLREGAMPLVIAADGVLCDLARTLAGGDVEVGCLLEGGEDPHTFALQPSHRRQLDRAAAILVNGLGLTPALARLNGNDRVIAVAERAEITPVSLSEPHSHHHQDHHGEGDVEDVGDRDGDGEGAPDPHVWHNPLNTAAMAGVVSGELALLRAERSEAFAQRRSRAVTILGALDRWTRVQIATVPEGQRVLATGHRAFASYAGHYGLRELPLLDGVTSHQQLRPGDLRRLLGRMKTEGVRTIFYENDPPSRALMAISDRSRVPLASGPLVPDGLTRGESLVETFTGNTCTVVNSLGGQCDRAGAQRLVEDWARITPSRS